MQLTSSFPIVNAKKAMHANPTDELAANCPIRAPLQNRLSYNATPCQVFFSTLLPALMTERHFALAENVAHQLNMARPTQARS
jgi:hypothetical protein